MKDFVQFAVLGLGAGAAYALFEIKYGFDTHRVEPFLPSHVYKVAGVTVQEDRIILLGIAVAVTAALWVFMKYTRIGLAITATAQNERAVSMMGWSPEMLS